MPTTSITVQPLAAKLGLTDAVLPGSFFVQRFDEDMRVVQLQELAEMNNLRTKPAILVVGRVVVGRVGSDGPENPLRDAHRNRCRDVWREQERRGQQGDTGGARALRRGRVH